MSRSDTAPADSSYHLRGATLEGRCCKGTACFVARGRNPDRWHEACQEPPIYCLGQCFAAPTKFDTRERPHIEAACETPVILERIAGAGSNPFDGLLRAREMGAEWLLAQVEESQIRGRGGAGFPAGRKWHAVAAQPGEKFVVANADEGDAGAYIDRYIMEDDPDALIEGLALAGLSVGATKGYIYLRVEYPAAKTHLEQAIIEAQDVLAEFQIELVIGHGSYVCGEETSLLNSIEGKKPFVRSRPPYPFQSGLFGKPTLINNVETLAAIPWIVRHGGEAYQRMGFSNSRGTKAVSLNSLFNKPGLYEVEFGVSVRHIVEELGGGIDGELSGVMIGGPLAGVLPPSLLDTSFGFEELADVGASVGHGGIIAFDETTSILELLQHVFEFGAFESCGKCTPCKVGSREVSEMLDGRLDWDSFLEEVRLLRDGTLCGHGTGLAAFADSLMRHYKEELQECFAHA